MEGQTKLLFLGDSITDADHNLDGDPDSLGDGYVRIIAERIKDRGVCFVNKGHDGFTVPALLRMLDADCISAAPDVVTVLIGCNDAGIEMHTQRTLKQQKFEENYGRLIRRIRTETAARILCMGPFIFAEPARYRRWFPVIEEAEAIERKMALRYGAEFLPLHNVLNRAADAEGTGEITVDGIHLNRRGARIVAEEWLALYKPSFPVGIIKEEHKG
ncbi:SGNH/GDSL hydrolase family protein [[Clostridium] hylemonae]|uniref:SGNH/GDSL hydrolase family protein n=1 Tax=[Clostridium] hylemonae TaxID=89153 RepID=UPI00018A1CAF|nr:GDSL-type esterase/lipase family protein [[Clostridium] hylemonae]QEK16752.1 Acetylxylan esterase [[Clostridium] hylemonae DSM 15053]